MRHARDEAARLLGLLPHDRHTSSLFISVYSFQFIHFSLFNNFSELCLLG
jgi:hypothetical protein